MSLRIRLVASLAVLFTVGLAVYGWGTYQAFARTEVDRVDDQLVQLVPIAARELFEQAEFEQTPSSTAPFDDGGRDGDRDQPTLVVAPGTYAELRTAAGDVAAVRQDTDASVQPLVAEVTPSAGERLLTTVAGSDDDSRWRVLAESLGQDAPTVVVAIPLSEVAESLQRLVTIELLAGLALLGVLGLGAWLLLRRGLHPLEEIAGTAGSISAGADLDTRVPHADEHSEVGQLATAINGMLDDLQGAFREREATEARLRRFLADASHELRTPLTSIRGFAELFRLGADSPDADLPTIMRRIEQESDRMGVLVEDLLTLARLDEHRPVQRGPVDLAVLAADTCTDAAAVDPDRPLALDTPDALVVHGSEDHLRQALANLVTNALRHTPPGTPVEVRAVRDGDTAVVTVRDHGAGLDPDAIPHLFDRFWQADAARVGVGTGLGLSIVAAIATEHGGTAEAANHPDGGAVFTLRLPIDGPDDRSGRPADGTS